MSRVEVKSIYKIRMSNRLIKTSNQLDSSEILNAFFFQEKAFVTFVLS